MSGRLHLSLAGEVFDIRRGTTHSWSITTGVDPFVAEYTLQRDAVAKIFDLAAAQFRKPDPRRTRLRTAVQPIGPLALEFDGGPSDKVTINGLYVIARLAGDDHLNTETLLVADRRWLWRLVPVERRFNVPRPTPEKRWIDGVLVPLQVARVVPDLTHERQTLKNLLTTWTAEEVLVEVMEHLCGPDGFVLRRGQVRLRNAIQGLELHDFGHAALARVLGEVPGLQPFHHPDGRIHFTDELDGSEQAVFTEFASAPLSGSFAVQDRSLSIPSRLYCGFEREHEIRFDFEEVDQTALVTRARPTPGREEPTLENRAQITDAFLTIAGARLAMGSWVRILEDLLPAWVAEPGTSPAVGGEITQKKILRHLLGGLAVLRAIYRRIPGAPDALLGKRLNTIQKSYRYDYFVVRQWMDKLRFIAARRATIVDQETGTRARSDAFCDVVSKPSLLGLAPLGSAVIGSDEAGHSALIRAARPAPAEVQVFDPKTGYIRISFRTNLTGSEDMVVPGKLDAPFPEADAAARVVLWNQVSLDASFKLSVILTGVPSVPNDEGRLWWHEVSLAEACRALGAPVPAANGPDRHVLCGDTSARFVWLDAQALEIKESIWEGKRPPENLLVNPLEVKDVAVAQAARVVSPLLPRVVGRVQVELNGQILPTGSLRRVVHGITSNNVAFTQLDAPSAAPSPPGVFALLPERTRKILARLVED